MASLLSLLSMARDGVLAHSGALNITSQNVAGANTPGYVRRSPVLQSVPSGGVTLAATRRSFDRFTYAQLVDQESRLASDRTRAGALSHVEALVSPTTNHIGERADALFDALHELSLHPSDMAVRSSVLARAEWVAAGFSEAADGLARFRDELYARASDSATEVSERLARIAETDVTITEARARGEDASALLDRRDQLIREIGERVDVRVIEDASGAITLFGAGTVLYNRDLVARLGVSLDANGSLRIEARREGAAIDVTSTISTGTLAGIREARDVDIPEVLSTLDTFARDLADAVNAVHGDGFGLDGGTGRPLFAPPAGAAGAAHAMRLDSSIAGRPELLAAARSPGDLPGGNDNAARLANLASTSIPGGGTISERYAGIASEVGVLRTEAEGGVQLREETVATSSALRESVSGVSTDEEMILLQQYQRGFEAATRVLRVVDELFDDLMASIR